MINIEPVVDKEETDPLISRIVFKAENFQQIRSTGNVIAEVVKLFGLSSPYTLKMIEDQEPLFMQVTTLEIKTKNLKKINKNKPIAY